MPKDRYIEAEDYFEMACEWIKARETARAEECLLHALSLNPHFIYAYIELAALYSRGKLYQEAVNTIRKALRHDPEFHHLYFLLSKYAFRNGQYSSSLQTIDRAIELNPCELYHRVRSVIERYHRNADH